MFRFLATLLGGIPAAVEAATMPEAPTATGPVTLYSSSALVAQEELVVYTLAHKPGGRTKTNTGRHCVALQGGELIGPAKTGGSSPMVYGHVLAVDGDTFATVHGLPLQGHAYADGLHARFGIEGNLDERAYTRIAAALGRNPGAQLRVTAVRSRYGVNNKRYDSRFGGEFVEHAYGAVRELRAPVTILKVELVPEGTDGWVAPAVKAVSREGVYGTSETPKAHKAADLKKVFGSLGQGPVYVPAATTAAPAKEPVAAPAADEEAQAILDQLMGQEPDLG
jgi:hypothetical protein